MDAQKIEELKQKFGIGNNVPSVKTNAFKERRQVIKEIQEAVKHTLPNWRLTEKSFEQLGGRRTNAIEELKSAVKKDLPQWHLSPTYIENHADLEALQPCRTIMVRLNNEVTEKVAEYKNGRVQIIQG